jgi:hypothetical protein
MAALRGNSIGYTKYVKILALKPLAFKKLSRKVLVCLLNKLKIKVDPISIFGP